MKVDVSKLQTEFKFSKSKVQNKKGVNIGLRLARKMKIGRKEIKLDKKMLDPNYRKDGIEIINLLKGSSLPKGLIIKDLPAFGCDITKIPRGLPLPKKLLEVFY